MSLGQSGSTCLPEFVSSQCLAGGCYESDPSIIRLLVFIIDL